MKRRGSGEGSITQLANGQWKAIHTVSWKPRRTRTKTFKQRSQAASWLAQQSVERKAGTESGPVSADLLFAEWVTTWLSDIERDREANTHSLYKMILETLVVPYLGSSFLRDLKPMAFRNLFNTLENQTLASELAKKEKQKPYDPNRKYAQTRTLETVWEVCSRCMAAAVKLELIESNPVSKVSKPKYGKQDIRPFTVAEVKAILKQAEPHRLYALFVVLFFLGVRQGEAFALRWDDVDWERQTLRIDRQAANNGGKIVVKAPKTKNGRRTLDLPDEVLDALRLRQARALKDGQAGNPLIFPAREGGYLHRSTLAHRHWKKILLECGIDPRGLHHARHTFATHALTEGCPLHIVSKILGHSSPTVTLETYAHLIDTAQRGTVEKVAKLFAG
jgi:integrase